LWLGRCQATVSEHFGRWFSSIAKYVSEVLPQVVIFTWLASSTFLMYMRGFKQPFDLRSMLKLFHVLFDWWLLQEEGHMVWNSTKAVVVTGGAGFIGSAVIRAFNARGCSNIIVVDNLGTSEKWKNLVGKQFAEVLHKDRLFDYLRGRESSISGIIHLGACSNTLELDAGYLLENNYRYSQQLAIWALEHQLRFVYASSAATYGDGSQGFSDAHEGLEALHPLNMYGYSKHLFDLWLYRNGLLNRVTGIKYFNVYGPNEWHKGRMASAILRMVPEVLKNGCIRLFASPNTDYSDGEQCRDFIYVKDAAEITCDLFGSDVHGIFNVGTGQATSWNQLATAVFLALQRAPSIEYIPMPSDLVGKYQYWTKAETGKISHALSRPPCRYTVNEAVADYVQNHLVGEVRW
jgi:ADP-L-glycero-D-manno-heptose 6-epimerase